MRMSDKHPATPNDFDFGRNCYTCGATVWFKESCRSNFNGARIPFNRDGSRHYCRKSSVIRSKLQVETVCGHITSATMGEKK